MYINKVWCVEIFTSEPVFIKSFLSGELDLDTLYCNLLILYVEVYLILISQDERQCALCKTTIFMSALTIVNGRDDQEIVCLRHFKSMDVEPCNLILRYRQDILLLWPIIWSDCSPCYVLIRPISNQSYGRIDPYLSTAIMYLGIIYLLQKQHIHFKFNTRWRILKLNFIQF